MKKNFLKVAAMLIAAMLMVVSCTQEIAPVNNELVEARLGLAYGKDVTVNTADGAVITYTYALEPQWVQNQDFNGTQIYGTKAETAINGTYKVSETVSDVSLGDVTPGLWKITVKGYTNYNSETSSGTLVLKGENNAYFVNGNTTATVIVSPTSSDGEGSVIITLQMQDLGADSKNVINYTIYNVTTGETTTSSTPLTRSENATNNVYTYSASLDKVKAGFNTITFSTPEVAGEGGIVKTFLVIPGNSTEIKGSVYPAEFQTGKATIKTASISGSLSITGKEADSNGMYTLSKGTDNTITINVGDCLTSLANSLPAGATNMSTVYTWYVNGVNQSNSNNTTFTFNKATAGDYTVTCTVAYSFQVGTDTYKWIGDGSLGKIRVL